MSVILSRVHLCQKSSEWTDIYQASIRFKENTLLQIPVAEDIFDRKKTGKDLEVFSFTMTSSTFCIL